MAGRTRERSLHSGGPAMAAPSAAKRTSPCGSGSGHHQAPSRKTFAGHEIYATQISAGVAVVLIIKVQATSLSATRLIGRPLMPVVAARGKRALCTALSRRSFLAWVADFL